MFPWKWIRFIWGRIYTYYWLRQKHVPFACARFRPYNNAAKVERVAILKPYRKDGYGKTMMHAIERFAKDKGYNQLVLNAQVQAQGFYEKLGYIQTGPVFIEENIDHIKCIRIFKLFIF